jgi:hypothetical protein
MVKGLVLNFMERGNILIRLFFVVFLSLIFSALRAQYSSGLSQIIFAKTLFRYYLPDNSLSSNVPLNEIRSSVFRSFLKRFPEALASRWIKTSEGYRMYFKVGDSVSYRIAYTQRGQLVREYVSYSESHAPADIKEIIMIRYPDYKIQFVNAFSDGKGYTYGIVIRHGDTEKSLKLQDGNLELLLQFENRAQVK